MTRCGGSRQSCGHSTVPLLLCCLMGFAAIRGAAGVQMETAGIGATLTAPIAPQALAPALAALAQQTSMQLIYESRLVTGRRSQGVPAGVSLPEALRRLLQGTGLDFEFLNPRTIRLVESTPSQPRRAARASAIRQPGPLIGTLRAVIVTAEKRPEDLGTVPISVSVLAGEAMQRLGVVRMRDIAEITPGIAFESSSQWGPAILTDLAVRGITSTATISGTKSSVGSATTGVYIDDIPITMPQSSFTNPYPVTFDLARVEVLRGPQGTLFGGRAEGGAIRFITTAPSTTSFDGLTAAEVSATDRGGMSYQAGAAAGGPLIEGLLGARASVFLRRDGGYVDRVDPLTGATADPAANRPTVRAARLALLIEPRTSIRITPSFLYQSTALHDSPSFFVEQSDPDRGIFRNGKLLRQPASDSFSLASLGIQAKGAASTLTAITSWFDRTTSATVDTTNAVGAGFGGFGNPLGPAFPADYADAVPTLLGAHQYQFTQELRLASDDAAAPMSWLAGLFYAHARQKTSSVAYSIAAPQAPYIAYDTHNGSVDLAAFGEATIRLSSRWRALGGARLTRARTEVSTEAQGLLYPVPGLVHVALDETPLTPRFGLVYEDGPGHLLYVTAAKGFRTGGASPVRPDRCEPTPVHPYGGDSLWSYELGTKHEWLDRLRLDGSLFYILWKNIQSDAVAPCTYPDIVNAGGATSKGFDLTIDLAAGARTDLKLAIAFVDARYSSTARLGSDVIVAKGTAVGGALYCPAPWSATLSAEHRMPLGARLSLYAGAYYIVRSHNPGPFLESDPASSSYNPGLRSDPATHRLDLRIGIIRAGTDIRLSFLNVLDATPVLLRDNDAAGSSLYYGQTFRPRTVALSVSRRL